MAVDGMDGTERWGRDYATTENPCNRHSTAPSLSSNLSRSTHDGEGHQQDRGEQEDPNGRVRLGCFRLEVDEVELVDLLYWTDVPQHQIGNLEHLAATGPGSERQG